MQTDIIVGMVHQNMYTIKEREYRRVLLELGFEKPDNEQLTREELSQIFMHMQEELFIVS